MPVGLARVADLHRGFDVDPLHPRAGRARGRGRVVALRLLAAWRVHVAAVDDRVRRATARSRSDCCEHGRLSPSADIGVRFALDPGRGETSTGDLDDRARARRSPIALLAGLWSFQVSLQHMLDSPRLYGWNWSVKSGAPALPDVAAALVPAFSHDPVVSALRGRHDHPGRARARAGRRDGHAAGPGAASRRPWSKAGCPDAPNEVMLGTRNLERAGLHLGDIAVLRLGNTAAGLRIVGRGLFPEFGDAGGLGNGVYMTYGGLQAHAARGAPERVPRAVPAGHRRPAAETAHLAPRARPVADARHRASRARCRRCPTSAGCRRCSAALLVVARGGDARAHA